MDSLSSLDLAESDWWLPGLLCGRGWGVGVWEWLELDSLGCFPGGELSARMDGVSLLLEGESEFESKSLSCCLEPAGPPSATLGDEFTPVLLVWLSAQSFSSV